MAHQSIKNLKEKIEKIKSKAETVLELGEIRSYDYKSYVCFNVKTYHLLTVDGILSDLPIPKNVINKFNKNFPSIFEHFLNDQREAVHEWFKNDDNDKKRAEHLYHIDLNEVGFYGRNAGHFAFFTACEIEEMVDECENALNYTDKNDLLDFIKDNMEQYEIICDDILWIYKNFVKNLSVKNEDWKEEVLYNFNENFIDDIELDDDEIEEIIEEIKIDFDYQSIEFLKVTKKGVYFIVYLNDNKLLLNKNSFIGLYNNIAVEWLDSYGKGENLSIKNFLENRKKLLVSIYGKDFPDRLFCND